MFYIWFKDTERLYGTFANARATIKYAIRMGFRSYRIIPKEYVHPWQLDYLTIVEG